MKDYTGSIGHLGEYGLGPEHLAVVKEVFETLSKHEIDKWDPGECEADIEVSGLDGFEIEECVNDAMAAVAVVFGKHLPEQTLELLIAYDGPNATVYETGKDTVSGHFVEMDYYFGVALVSAKTRGYDVAEVKNTSICRYVRMVRK